MSDCGVCIGHSDCDEQWDFFESKTVRARKPHRCFECRRTIKPGDRYQRVSGKYDGDVSSHSFCLPCDEIMDAFACSGSLEYGSLWEEMREYAFPVMTTGCLDRLQTTAAKEFLMEKWNEWKFGRAA